MRTKIRLKHGLPFIEINISYNGQKLRLPNVLIDTGSAKYHFEIGSCRRNWCDS